ncbi:MAG: metal ABC transporter permease [Bacteroidales bacterium]|nr:metal ABC transporter permease [Bacteroidales bacterium]MCF8332968.1 metal ABC transporter permease [Bacteroidales bacterium]
MDTFFEAFQYTFMQNALLAAIFTGISCGIIGTYIVSKRIVFISGGITHTSFGGIGIGYYMGFNPLLGAAIFAVLSAIGIEYFSRKSEIRHDSMIGIFWSFGMALGIIFIFLTPGYAPNLMSYLFGSILTVSLTDTWLMLGLSLLIGTFFSLMYRPILYIAYDETYARTRNIPVSIMKYVIMALVALAIVLSIRVIGIILVISLMTIPQTTANIFTKKFKNIMFYSVIIALIGTMAGLFVSYKMDIPSGASIIFSLVILFILAKIGKFVQRRSLS